MLKKSIDFICFSIFFYFVCFPPLLHSLCKTFGLFCLKLRILVGNRRAKKCVKKKMKRLSVLDAYPSAACTKSSKFGRVMIIQTQAHGGENWWFFNIFPKKRSNRER